MPNRRSPAGRPRGISQGRSRRRTRQWPRLCRDRPATLSLQAPLATQRVPAAPIVEPLDGRSVHETTGQWMPHPLTQPGAHEVRATHNFTGLHRAPGFSRWRSSGEPRSSVRLPNFRHREVVDKPAFDGLANGSEPWSCAPTSDRGDTSTPSFVICRSCSTQPPLAGPGARTKTSCSLAHTLRHRGVPSLLDMR